MANILILGGTSSIAQAIALQMQKNQHTVTLCGRNPSTLAAIAAGLSCQYFVADLSRFESVCVAFENHLEQIGQIDAVVNCAGSLLLKTAEHTAHQEYLGVIESNLTTAFATVHAAQKYMTQGGSVLLFSSAAALTGLANHEAIAAAKAAIIGLTLAAAASSAGKNLRFNALAPGLVETHLTAAMLSSLVARQFSNAMHP